MKENEMQKPEGEKLRPHIYDGIQEYDNKLPNWWLLTLYGAIVFAVIYWFTYYDTNLISPDAEQVKREMSRIEEARLAAIGELSDDTLWQMAGNEGFVASGKTIYMEKCVQCHGPELQGGIGLNLADHQWRYISAPMDVYKIVANGSPDKTSGMQAWIGELGPQRVSQVAAFVLSHHSAEEMADAPVEKPGAL